MVRPEMWGSVCVCVCVLCVCVFVCVCVLVCCVLVRGISPSVAMASHACFFYFFLCSSLFCVGIVLANLIPSLPLPVPHTLASSFQMLSIPSSKGMVDSIK